MIAIRQLEFAASIVPHVEVPCVKSAALGPVNETAMLLKVVEELLSNVTFFDGAGTLAAWLLKDKAVGAARTPVTWLGEISATKPSEFRVGIVVPVTLPAGTRSVVWKAPGVVGNVPYVGPVM